MPRFSVLYGVPHAYVDVTNQCVRKSVNGTITIPKTDWERCEMFYRDPAPQQVKHVLLLDAEAGCLRVLVNFKAVFPTGAESLTEVTLIDHNIDRKEWWDKLSKPCIDRDLPELRELQQRLNLLHGSFDEELPEQRMAIKHILPTDTVLELGTNIGRNSLIIGTILDDDRRLVTLESNPQHAREAEENRVANSMNFQIEPSALSARPLIQEGWYSQLGLGEPASTKFSVNTITWPALQQKYGLHFNVLVADCEGAVFHILEDEPDFFKGFDTVILENDFTTDESSESTAAQKKDAVDAALRASGLSVVYSEPGPDYAVPYIRERFAATWSRFYEVWKRQ